MSDRKPLSERMGEHPGIPWGIKDAVSALEARCEALTQDAANYEALARECGWNDSKARVPETYIRKRIEALEKENRLMNKTIASSAVDIMRLENKNEALEADNARMREALQITDADEKDGVQLLELFISLRKNTLSTPVSDWLAEHDRTATKPFVDALRDVLADCARYQPELWTTRMDDGTALLQTFDRTS